MHYSRLAKWNQKNDKERVRERQIQMGLYSATVSLLPKHIYVTPEWRTHDKHGFVDLVIDLEHKLWFLELL
ncbi:hypothetical protein HDU91_001573, partial [Kappamyces sp. JEL0680]